MRVMVRNQLIELLHEMISKEEEFKTDKKMAAYLKLMEEEFQAGFSESTFYSYLQLLQRCKDKCAHRRLVPRESMRAELAELQARLREEPEVKLEVVFMPYKSSMWDALESIYLSALENPRCNAYVVPIPYYKKDSKGNLTKKYYEGELFPEEQEMLYYENYNLAAHHPDLLFIHNAYDDQNRITSVKPEYYSDELMKHTEHLVYIPYFVAGFQNVRINYYILPGIRNAWRVYVQSKHMAKEYQYWNPGKDVRGIGSPKMDALFKKLNGEIDIPVSWKKKLDSKKVILLNTHLSGVISNIEDFIDNIQYLFSVVREQQRAVVLLWRPHPLTEETILCYAPDKMKEYREIVSWAKEQRYIIFDDTGDMERALVLSDMYIGNQSSLLRLYMGLGRPIHILGEGKLRKKDEYAEKKGFAFSIESGCCVGNVLWFVPRNINGLFKMPLENKEVTFVKFFEEEEYLQDDLFLEILHYQGELWFFPCSARKIYVLNLREMEWRSMGVPVTTEEIKFLFGAVFQVGRKVYLLPHSAESAILVDMETDKIEIAEGFVPRKEDTKKKEKFERCYSGHEGIYAVYKGTNYILEFDKQKEQACFCRAGKETDRYNLLIAGEKCLLLFPETGGYVDLYTRDYKFLGREQLIDEKDVQATSGVMTGKEVWITYIPNLIVRWDMENNSIERWKHPKESKNTDVGVSYGAYGPGRFCKVGQEVFCLPGDYGIMMEYDRQGRRMNQWFVSLSWDWFNYYTNQKVSEMDERIWNIVPIREFIHQGIAFGGTNQKSLHWANQILGDFTGNVGQEIIKELVEELW